MPALLSPQGKILFDFFVVRVADGYLLDVAAAKAADLVKRLTMYKLRADVAMHDVSVRLSRYRGLGQGAAALTETRTCIPSRIPAIASTGHSAG